MNKKDFVNRILPELIRYKVKTNNAKPITLTFSVTAACQSKCKTCQIGHLYLENPMRADKDLTLDEIEKIFSSMKSIYFFNMSGGEPFLRDDLPQIVELACKYLKPAIIHTPTNAILSGKIYNSSKEILEIIKKYNPKVPFTVKPSIDGVGDKHDEIRGVKGNFKKLLKTIELLKELEKEYDNFHLELGTVISNFNINDLDEIEDFVHSLGVESYRNEVAEQRTEFFNIGDLITPNAEVYQALIKNFSDKIKKNIRNKRSLAKTTEAFRIVYYQLAGRILKENRQVIPCYAGTSNAHINYDGGVWPCCVLGYDKQLGSLREYDYNFDKLWKSKQASEVREFIRNKNCACPLANQAYSNILMDPVSLSKVAWYMLKFRVS